MDPDLVVVKVPVTDCPAAVKVRSVARFEATADPEAVPAALNFP